MDRVRRWNVSKPPPSYPTRRVGGTVRLWKGVPADLGWVGLLLFSFLADASSAGAQAAGSAAQSSSTTQSVAGQQRIRLDGFTRQSRGAALWTAASGIPAQPFRDATVPDTPAESETAKPQASLQSQRSMQSPQTPVGTAAAEALRVSGVAASQPAGVEIAPAKRCRVRTIVIRVGDCWSRRSGGHRGCVDSGDSEQPPGRGEVLARAR
jgi:hypothetical protein